MAKTLFVVGFVSFWVALIAELGFVMLRLTEPSSSDTTTPTSTPGLVVWGSIGLGVLCWGGAAAALLRSHLRNRS